MGLDLYRFHKRFLISSNISNSTNICPTRNCILSYITFIVKFDCTCMCKAINDTNRYT